MVAAADFIQVAASALLRLVVFGPLRWADSGQQAQQVFVPLPADLDQLRASAHLARGLAAFHLLPVREHSRRGQLYPGTTSL